MFAKILSGIKLAREGVRQIDKVKRAVEAVEVADKDLDGHPDVQELKALVLDIRTGAINLFAQCKQAFVLIVGLITAAKEA